MRAALHNLGCKTNFYETEAMEQTLKNAGFEIVDFNGDIKADIYIINTCSVTNIADRKSRQMLHKAKRKNPNAIIVAAGCFVQTADIKALEKEPVDIFLGSNDKAKLLKSIKSFLSDKKRQSFISQLKAPAAYERLEINNKPRHTRAFIKIEDGCNQFCTFCIIPYARGRVRSRGKGEIVSEARKLSEAGVKEIVLTGINMSAYGSDFDDGSDIGDLILSLQEILGIERIRISSLEPGLITEEFLKKIKTADKLCPHFHLSLQSGSDSVLKRMKRKYDCSEYLSKLSLLRSYYSEPTFTTDIITGFPKESEEEFRETLDFIKGAGFFDIHVFQYSKREGTPAAKMTGQIDGRIKRVRSAALISEAAKLKTSSLMRFLGREAEVLIEEQTTCSLFPLPAASHTDKLEGAFFSGHTREYIKVYIPVSGEYNTGDTLKLTLDNIYTDENNEMVLTGKK